jgi:hypothetical protein
MNNLQKVTRVKLRLNISDSNYIHKLVCTFYGVILFDGWFSQDKIPFFHRNFKVELDL